MTRNIRQGADEIAKDFGLTDGFYVDNFYGNWCCCGFNYTFVLILIEAARKCLLLKWAAQMKCNDDDDSTVR